MQVVIARFAKIIVGQLGNFRNSHLFESQLKNPARHYILNTHYYCILVSELITHMHKELKRYLRNLWQSVIFWTLALFLWGLLRFYGLADMEGIHIDAKFQEAMQINFLLRFFTFAGILVGIIFANIEFFFEKYSSNKLTLGLRVFFKSCLYLLTVIIIATATKELAMSRFDLEINNDLGWWWEDKMFRAVIVYILLISVVFSFIKIANEKFGKGIFLKMLMGRYKNPKEEKRIFMFLDLRSSTTIAEILGHFKYSQLIQDCFYDLNDIVPKHSAEIYQYVGDEAVLSWPYHKGLADNNCVALFFEFQNLLAKKAPYYKAKYGLIPEFKAGLHGGKLMVAEVGVVKKELAFHGDVINTSARIQAECNNYNVPILISEILKDDLQSNNAYASKHIGNLLLKGKNTAVNLFTLSEN